MNSVISNAENFDTLLWYFAMSVGHVGEVSSVRQDLEQCGLKIERTTSPTGSNNNSNACGGWGNKEKKKSMRSLLDWCVHTKTKKKFCSCFYCDACCGQPTRCTLRLLCSFYLVFIIFFILLFQVRRIFRPFQQAQLRFACFKYNTSYVIDIGRSVVQTSFIFTIGFCCCCVIMLLLYFVWSKLPIPSCLHVAHLLLWVPHAHSHQTLYFSVAYNERKNMQNS